MANIVLIDDDRNLLQMVKLMLTRAGHAVETAHDGEHGITLAQQQQPDLVVVDVMMPGMNGYDVVRRLRTGPQTAQIPIIMLTARSQPMDKHKALEAGANAFLSKPITSKELLDRVDAVIDAGVNFRVHTGLLTEPVPPKTPSSAPFTGPASSTPHTPRPAPAPPTTPVFERGSRPPWTGARVPIGAEDVPRVPETPPVLLPAITVISLRGGTGVTTVAVNLALLLAQRGERIALADFSTASGHVHLHLHLPAQKNWGKLLEQGEIPDARLLNRLLTPHMSSGIGVLAAPAVPPPQPLSTTAAQSVLRELNATFQRQIIDARSLDSAVKGALKVSSTVIVVLADDPPSIQSTGQLLLALKNMGVESGRVRLVLNHVRATTDVPVDTIQKALKRPLNGDLPYEPGHQAAIRRGTPVVLSNPEGAYARALSRLAQTLPL